MFFIFIKSVLVFVFLFFSISSSSSQISKPFNPSVSIFKSSNSNGGLKFVIEKERYTALYSSLLNSFDPIEMPFKIESTNSGSTNYVMNLSLSKHYCRVSNQEITTKELSVTDITLDSSPLALSPQLFKNHEYTIPAHSTNDHTLRIEFPRIDMKSEEQECFGTLGLTASIVGTML